MPTYDYQCSACGHSFEHFQSMSSRKLRKCPACSEAKLERLFGAGSGVIFKGSGFYETDYKRAGSSRPSEGDTVPSGESSKAEASGDAPAKSTPSEGSASGDSAAGKKSTGGDAGQKAGRKD